MHLPPGVGPLQKAFEPLSVGPGIFHLSFCLSKELCTGYLPSAHPLIPLTCHPPVPDRSKAHFLAEEQPIGR